MQICPNYLNYANFANSGSIRNKAGFSGKSFIDFHVYTDNPVSPVVVTDIVPERQIVDVLKEERIPHTIDRYTHPDHTLIRAFSVPHRFINEVTNALEHHDIRVKRVLAGNLTQVLSGLPKKI